MYNLSILRFGLTKLEELSMFKNLFKKQVLIDLHSPLDGEFKPINKVSDPVFSQEMLGRGVAVEPTNEVCTAPADCVVLQVFDTNHAIVLDVEGAEVLIHIGIDTVKMKGDGFTSLVKAGDTVKRGQALIHFSIEKIREAEHPLTTMMIVCNHADYSEFTVKETEKVNGDSVLISLAK